MTAQQQRLAIAEFCGWTGILVSSDHDGMIGWLGFKSGSVPNYLNDLNAIAFAEAKLTPEQFQEYRRFLEEITYPGNVKEVHPRGSLPLWGLDEHNRLYTCATAAQRAESLLRAIGRWSDADPEMSAVMRLGNAANDAPCQHCGQPGSDHRVKDSACPHHFGGIWSAYHVYQP